MSEAALDINATPGGLEKIPKPKRLGKLPIVLIGSVVVIFLVLLMVIMATRQAQLDQESAAAAKPEDRTAADVMDSRMSVEELLADAPSGTIPEYKPEKQRLMGDDTALVPGTIKVSERAPLGSETALGGGQVTPNHTVSTGNNATAQASADPLGVGRRSLEDGEGGLPPLNEQEAERVRQLVNQRLESALFSPTSVQFNSQAMGRQVGAQGQAGANTAVDPNRDVMSVYRERLAEIQNASQALSGGGGYPGGIAGGAGLPGIGNGADGSSGPAGFGANPTSNWALGAERVAGQFFTLKSGGMIPAVMISGINSDLPGQIIAQVSQNVFDTATGHDLLIPQGTRMFGRYGSDNRVGDTRVAVKWDRLIFPDGSTLDLKEMNGSDQEGYSGFKDQVNNHYFKIFGGAALLSLISAGYQIALGDDDNNSGNTDNGLSAKEQISIQMAQQMNQVGAELIRRNMRVQPTIIIRPGYRFMVMVNKDVSFQAPYSPMELTHEGMRGQWGK